MSLEIEVSNPMFRTTSAIKFAFANSCDREYFGWWWKPWIVFITKSCIKLIYTFHTFLVRITSVLHISLSVRKGVLQVNNNHLFQNFPNNPGNRAVFVWFFFYLKRGGGLILKDLERRMFTKTGQLTVIFDLKINSNH